MWTDLRGYLTRRMMLPGLLILFSLAIVGFAGQPRLVTIEVDGKTITTETRLRSPVGIAKEASIHMAAHDQVNVISNDPLVLQVKRAVPLVLVVDGQEKPEVITTATRVDEAMKALGYDTAQYVTGIPADTPVTPHMKLPIYRYTTEDVKREEMVPYAVEVVPNDKMLLGEEQLIANGQNGQEVVTYRRVLIDGKPIKEEAVHHEVKVAPIPQRVERGTRSVMETSRGVVRFSQVIEMEATAYHPMDGDGNGITASGIPAHYGVVAVDPDVIPLGTRLYIPGYGEALAADTGGAIVGNRIDLCMDSYDECYRYGRQSVKVFVLQ